MPRATEFVRRADKTAFQGDFAEMLVDAWITGGAQPPSHLRALVRNYRDLDYFVRTASVDQASPLYDQQNAIYDRLLTYATARGRVTVQAQVRRLQRRPQFKAERLWRRVLRRGSLREKWDAAIARWRAGVREVTA